MTTVSGWLLCGLVIAAGDVRLESVQVTLSEQVDVAAPVAGLVAELCVHEGEFVDQGELLGRIEDTEVQLQKRRAEVELANATKLAGNDISVRFAEKAREVADAELQRAKDSLTRYPKSISQTEIDRLRLESEKAALAVEQATFEFEAAQFAKQLRETDLELAVYNVQRRQLRAPLAGIVVEVNRRPGEWVDSSEDVFRILRIDRLRVEGFLDSKDVQGELVGRPVKLVTRLPGKNEDETFQGTMIFVSPEINPVNGQIRVWAEIENPDLQLRPGLRGTLLVP
jgi:macrolide-specific efflux system membrane fusion protein